MNKDEELSFLMNPTLYDKYKQLSSNEERSQLLVEKKFYRKRIQQMAKDCLKQGIFKCESPPPKQIVMLYDEFSKACISHFKTLDENEFYQIEYEGLDKVDNTSEPQEGPDVLNIKDLDTELLTNQPAKTVTMDDFVKKQKGKRPNSPLKPPKQRLVNVKEDKYRTKGLKKDKKNKSNE
jgi:hypothetical protein